MLPTLLLYNAVIFISSILLYVSEKDKNSFVRKITCILAFLVVVVPNAIRFEIGTDYLNYVKIYEDFEHGELAAFEPGFVAIIKLLQSLGLSADWLFIVVSFFIYFFVFLSYPSRYKYLANAFFLVIYYLISFNLLRQVMAISVAMFAISSFLEDDKSVKYYIWIYFCSLFHVVGLLFLFVPFVKNKMSNNIFKYGVYVFPVLCVFLFLFGGYVISGLLTTVAFLIPKLDFVKYLHLDRYSASGALGTGLGVLLKFCLYFYPFVFARKFIARDSRNIVIFLLLLCYILAWPLQFNMHIFHRLGSAFAFSFVLLVPLLYKHKILPFTRTYVLVLFLGLLAQFNFGIMKGHTSYLVTCNPERYYPYVTIFNKDDSQRSSRSVEQLCYKL